MPDPLEFIPPHLIEAQANWRQLDTRAKLRFPHFGQTVLLQDALAVEFTAVEQHLAEAAHGCCRRRYPAGPRGTEEFESDRRSTRAGAVALRGQLLQRLRRRLKESRMPDAERREDMRRHIVLEALAAHTLHDVAAQS